MSKRLKILIDVNHPAHVHFFKNTIKNLSNNGHQVIVTSRDKEFTEELLDGLGVDHYLLSSSTGTGIFILFIELIKKDYFLFKIAKKYKPDVMVSVGGTFISHVGFVTGIKSLVFYDTEIAKLQNLITYPFCTRLYVPSCYSSWTIKSKTIKYESYHELAYLHPAVFKPSYRIALENGLVPETKNYYVRLISWDANHDIGCSGLAINDLDNIIGFLSNRGNIIISSEKELPERFNKYLYKGNLNEVHHVMAYCQMYIGESATMASESAVLGVPALYIADSYRGYVDDIEKNYELIKSVKGNVALFEQIEIIDSKSSKYWEQARSELVNSKINLSAFIYNAVLE